MSSLLRLAARTHSAALATLFITRVATAQAPAAASAPRPLTELQVWGSFTAFSPGAGSNGTTSATGLRAIDVAYWPTNALRLSAGYENSLSLENLTLVRADRAVPLYRASALLDWGGRYTTVLEGGHRSLPEGVGQTLVSAEQVLYLTNGAALKAGAQFGARTDNRTEWVAHAGTNVSAGPRLRVEPVLFYAKSGLPGESQWRALLGAEYRPARDVSLAGGFAGGHNVSFDGAYTGAVYDSYVRATAPIGGLSRAHILIRHERASGARPFTTVAAGLSLVTARTR